MADVELIKMTVRIAGRDYPVRVKESERDMISHLAREINRKIKELQLQYNKNDIQDCLSMAALTYAVDAYQRSGSTKVDKDVSSDFDRIDDLLESMLQT